MATKIIWASTVQPKVVYSLFKLTPCATSPLNFEFFDKKGAFQDIPAYIKKSTKALQKKDHVLVFCLYKEH